MLSAARLEEWRSKVFPLCFYYFLFLLSLTSFAVPFHFMPVNFLTLEHMGWLGSIKKSMSDQEGVGLILMEELEKDEWRTEVDFLLHPILPP